MPISAMSTVTPSSRYWTHEQVVSEAMVLTNTLDNENIQLDNVRNHINKNISYVSNLLNLAAAPFYGIWMTGQLETTLHPSGLEWIDLSVIEPVSGAIPAQTVSDIKRLNVVSTGAATDWVGNCTKKDISELSELNSLRNVQYRHSVLWSHHGSELIFFVGTGIATVANALTGTAYNMSAQNVNVWAYRKPILDNVAIASSVAAQTAGGGNYRGNVDLPDEYMELLIKMTQKNILEQIREQVPQALEQEINQGLANINQMIGSELQFEAAERDKRKYGFPQRPPGAM